MHGWDRVRNSVQSSGTSSDWYLCDDPQELVEIADKLGTGVGLCLNSVLDLENRKGDIRLKK
jgi:hypothetical protein